MSSSRIRPIVLSLAAATVGFLAGFSPGSGRPQPATAPRSTDGRAAIVIAPVDPVAMAFSALEEKNGLRLQAALAAATVDFTREQWIRLADQVEALSEQERARILHHVISLWTRTDPRGVTDWMRPRLALIPTDPRYRTSPDWTEWRYIHAWATHAPEEALAYVRPLPKESELYQALLNSAVMLQAEREPAKAFASLRSMVRDEENSYAMATLFDLWAKNDPTAAQAAVASLPRGACQTSALGGLLRALAVNDPVRALEVAATLQLTDTATTAEVFNELAKGQPSLAAAWLERTGEAGNSFKGQVLATTWAQHDPAAALEWAVAQGISLSTPLNRSLVQGMFNNSGESPLASAMNANASATLAFIQSLPRGDERTRYIDVVIHRVEDDAQARALLQDLPPDARNAATVRLLAYRHARKMPDALEWIDTLPAETRQEAWIRIGQFLHNSPIEPGQIPPAGPNRDALSAGEAIGTFSFNTKQALEKAAGIVDPGLRRKTLHYVFLELSRYGNPATLTTAKEWLNESTVPEEWKRQWK